MHEPTRVRLFILCYTANSGITHYSISLARALSSYVDVTLVTGSGYADEGYPRESFAVWPFFHRSRWYPIDLARLFVLLLRHRPRTVLFQSVLKIATVDALFARAISLLGIETVMTVHDVLPHYPRPWSRLSHAFLYRSFAKLITHSERGRSDILALGARQPLLVVAHGLYDVFITRPPDRAESRRRLTSFNDGHFVVLFFGKIDARKGLGRFLDLYEAMASEQGYGFVIAGRNGLRASEVTLSSRLEKARMSSNCIVHDQDIPFNNVQDYLSLTDVVLLPYREGTTSGVLKLALTFGKPVIATDVGDIGETLRGGFGVLLPVAATTSDFVAAIQEVRGNFNCYATACVVAREQYRWPKIAAEYARFVTSGA